VITSIVHLNTRIRKVLRLVKKKKKTKILQNPINLAYQNLQHIVFLLFFVNDEIPSLAVGQVKKYKRKVIKRFKPIEVKDSMDFDKVIRFVKEIEKRKKKVGGNILRIQVESAKAHESLRLLSTLSNIETHFPKFIREVILTFLVSAFENFMADLLSTFYLNEPRALLPGSKEKQVNYKTIIESKNLEELKAKMVEKEISDVLFKNVDDIKVYFKSRHGIKMDELPEWSIFREVFYRRNIVVHNNGIANSEYRKKTGYTSTADLEVDEQYLEKCFEVFGIYSKLLAESFYDVKYNVEVESDLQE